MKITPKYNKLALFVPLLVMIDQSVKIFIRATSLYQAKTSYFLHIIRFHPNQNTDFSYLNDLLNLNMSKTAHVIFLSILLLSSIVAYNYLLIKNRAPKFLIRSFALIISGFLCTLIDILLWGGSLDFFELNGLFIFDIKDCYISTFEVIAIVFIIKNFQPVFRFKVSTLLKYLKIKSKSYYRILISKD